MSSPLKNLPSPLSFQKQPNAYMKKKLKEKAEEIALKKCLLLIDVFKKSNRMLTW